MNMARISFTSTTIGGNMVAEGVSEPGGIYWKGLLF